MPRQWMACYLLNPRKYVRRLSSYKLVFYDMKRSDGEPIRNPDKLFQYWVPRIFKVRADRSGHLRNLKGQIYRGAFNPACLVTDSFFMRSK